MSKEINVNVSDICSNQRFKHKIIKTFTDLNSRSENSLSVFTLFYVFIVDNNNGNILQLYCSKIRGSFVSYCTSFYV